MAPKPRQTFDNRFAIFQPMGENIGEADRFMVEYRSVSQLQPGNPVDISIPPMSQYYTDLSKSRLLLKVRICDKDTSQPIDENALVSLQNLALDTIWRQIDIVIGNKSTNLETGLLSAYKGIIDVITESSVQEAQSKLRTSLYVKDDAFFLDHVGDSTPGRNTGFEERELVTQEGKIALLEGKIRADVMNIDKLIINRVPIHFKFYPASNAFNLLSGDDKKYYIQVMDMRLKVQHILPHNDITLAYETILEKQPAIYNFNRSLLKSFTVPAGVYSWEVESLFPPSSVPDSLIVGMVSSEAFQGSQKLNGFNFQSFNINFMAFYVESHPNNNMIFSPSFPDNQYTNEYLSLFDSDMEGSGDGSMVSYDDYKGGYALFRFKIARGMEKDRLKSPQKDGQNRISLRFDKALDHPITVICYGKKAHSMFVDKERMVTI
jgi:hypothetical protein